MFEVNLMCKECGYVPIVHYGDNPCCNQMFEPINKTCKCKQHQFVEIDAEILLPLSILVNKGYKTNFSCAGHINQGYNSAYVYLKDKLPDELLPKSRWIEIDDDRDDSVTLRGISRVYLNINDLIMLQEDINMFRSELFKWVLSLPDKNK